MKPNILIHVPHTSMYMPKEYKQTALIPQAELEEDMLFMCDTGIVDLIPKALEDNAIIFPYSRFYCDVERFRDGSEPMDAYGMGYIYTKTSKGTEVFRPTKEHIATVDAIFESHHRLLDETVTDILAKHGSCIIIDLHSFSDETVDRLFGHKNCPDVCIGTEADYYDEDVVEGIERLCKGLGLTTQRNYPYSGSIVPNKYYGKKDTGIVSVMLEINKRVLR